MTAFDKIFIARTVLSIKQKEAAEQAGLKQYVIGSLERGEKNYIPHKYLSFLHKNGIDLNWIFNDEDNRTDSMFRNQARSITSMENSAYADEHFQLILTMILERLNMLTEAIVR